MNILTEVAPLYAQKQLEQSALETKLQLATVLLGVGKLDKV